MNWIAGAVKHRGAATAAAKREGVGVQDWAREHAHDADATIRGRAQFALRAKAGFKKRASVRDAFRMK